jgi:hypothetical protein
MEQAILDSLQYTLSLEDVEQTLTRSGHPPCDDIIELKEMLKEGDELWYFITPAETWTTILPRCGLEGVALIRHGRVVFEIFYSIS